MTDKVEQDLATPQNTPPQQPQNKVIDQAQKLEAVKQAILNDGLAHYQNYREFMKRLSLEPMVLSGLLQKLDDTWVWARVVVSEMQFQTPQT